jgi:two-component system, OmpR family, phosphate regulon sensor histidine kinase PhoR
MITFVYVLLGLSLAANAVLLYACGRFVLGSKRLKQSVADARRSDLRRRIHFGFGSRALAGVSTELNVLMDLFEDILEKQRRLELSHKQLIANISHDIRTPLTSLTGYIEVLRSQALTDGERGEYLDVVYLKARALHRMIEELFELAKLEADDTAPELTAVDVCGVVKETLAACYQDFARAAVTPRIELPDGPVTALGNRDAIERVLHNLLSNAVRHGGGGTVRVSVEADGGRAYVRVKDTGRGIAQADLPYVFDRLYTADSSRAAGGAGLGLAIAKQLIAKQNGEIGVRSEPGVETEFFFYLPKI